MAEALGRLGVRVERYRRPALDPQVTDRRAVFAVIGPMQRLDAREGAHLAELPGDLLLAGEGTDAAMSCLGYRVSERGSDPAALKAPRGAEDRPMPRSQAELVPHLATTIVDSSDTYSGRRISCSVPVPSRVDTVLRTIDDRPVAIRAEYVGGRTVTLVADDGLFRNRTLRRTAAGPIMLGLIPPRYRRVVVDEFHQGFTTSGTSLAGRDARLERAVAVGMDRLAAGRGRGGGAGRLGDPVRTGAARHPAPAPLAARARARAGNGARRGSRPRDRRAPHGAGTSPAALARRPRRARRPGPLAGRTGELPAHRPWPSRRSQP